MDSLGRRLLVPTDDSWGKHFGVINGSFVSQDPDGAYTIKGYDLNDIRKVKIRAHRKEFIAGKLLEIEEAKRHIERLNEIAERLMKSPETQQLKEGAEILSVAKGLQARIQKNLRELQHYSAIPLDAPLSCRCEPRAELRLPPELLRQMIVLPDPESKSVSSAL
jgi:hypothetical protein